MSLPADNEHLAQRAPWEGIEALVGEHRTLDEGYRLRPREQTLQRVLPLQRRIGVSRLAEVTDLDRLGIPVVAATRAGARRGQNTTVQGCGPTREAAAVAALMEAVERHSAARPCEVMKATVAELEARGEPFVAPERLGAPRSDRPWEWISGRRLRTNTEVWLPAADVLFPYDPPPGVVRPVRPSTSGLASGNTLGEAILHALFEVIERNVVSCPDDERPTRFVDPDDLGPEEAQLVERLRAAEIDVLLVEVGSRLAIPTFRVFSVDRQLGQAHLAISGQSTHVDPHRAVRRALYELFQSRVVAIQGSREDLIRHMEQWQEPLSAVRARLGLLAMMAQAGGRSRLLEQPRPPLRDLGELLHRLCSRLADLGFEDVIYTDLTDPEVNVPVARVRVPGLVDAWVDPERGSRVSTH